MKPNYCIAVAITKKGESALAVSKNYKDVLKAATESEADIVDIYRNGSFERRMRPAGLKAAQKARADQKKADAKQKRETAKAEKEAKEAEEKAEAEKIAANRKAAEEAENLSLPPKDEPEQTTDESENADPLG